MASVAVGRALKFGGEVADLAELSALGSVEEKGPTLFSLFLSLSLPRACVFLVAMAQFAKLCNQLMRVQCSSSTKDTKELQNVPGFSSRLLPQSSTEHTLRKMVSHVAPWRARSGRLERGIGIHGHTRWCTGRELGKDRPNVGRNERAGSEHKKVM